jgi:Protein involved in initiation of plasmid replication
MDINHPITYDKTHYAVMANEIVKGKQEMTLTEARIVRLLITQVVKEDRDLKTYTCRIQDLANFLNIGSDNLYREVRTVCDNLLTRIVRIGTGDPKDPWLRFQWVQLANYDGNGNLTLKLSEQIVPYVLELNSWFTQYRLENILEFNSFYAIRLYELLKCYDGINRSDSSCLVFSIDYLRTVFCCEKKYDRVNDFIKRVIEISVREINEKSDILILFDVIKEKKTISEIHFHISENMKTYISRKEY